MLPVREKGEKKNENVNVNPIWSDQNTDDDEEETTISTLFVEIFSRTNFRAFSRRTSIFSKLPEN